MKVCCVQFCNKITANIDSYNIHRLFMIYNKSSKRNGIGTQSDNNNTLRFISLKCQLVGGQINNVSAFSL